MHALPSTRERVDTFVLPLVLAQIIETEGLSFAGFLAARWMLVVRYNDHIVGGVAGSLFLGRFMPDFRVKRVLVIANRFPVSLRQSTRGQIVRVGDFARFEDLRSDPPPVRFVVPGECAAIDGLARSESVPSSVPSFAFRRHEELKEGLQKFSADGLA